MSACACIGPIGNCPCIRSARGQHNPISETYISTDIWNFISDADKKLINKIKDQAFTTWFQTISTTEKPYDNPSSPKE